MKGANMGTWHQENKITKRGWFVCSWHFTRKTILFRHDVLTGRQRCGHDLPANVHPGTLLPFDPSATDALGGVFGQVKCVKG